jgi:hypothetical protein
MHLAAVTFLCCTFSHQEQFPNWKAGGFSCKAIEICNTLYTNILSTLLYLRERKNFSFLILLPFLSILFSSGSSYFLLSASRLVPLFRIQDAVSKSNYYGRTLRGGEGVGAEG